MDTASIALLLTLGAAVGFAAGLLGIGGGMLMVPFMTMILAAQGFPDHHPYTERDLAGLAVRSAELDAQLVTTPKDAVRLPAPFRECVTVIGVTLAWEDPETLDRLLADLHPGQATT